MTETAELFGWMPWFFEWLLLLFLGTWSDSKEHKGVVISEQTFRCPSYCMFAKIGSTTCQKQICCKPKWTLKKIPKNCTIRLFTANAQWIPMHQFRFENYDTLKRFQTQKCRKAYHLQVVSSPCPDFQTFRAIFDIFLDFSWFLPYDFMEFNITKP